jgi:hypothetical protein
MPLSFVLLLIPRGRFQAASQKFGRPIAFSKGDSSRELKQRVEQYERSKVELQQPRQVSAWQNVSSGSSIDNRVEKAVEQLQRTTAELAEALGASGKRASPAVVKAMEGSIAMMTQLLHGGW